MTAFVATTQHVATITSLTRPLLVARAASFQASIQEHTTNSHKSKEENSCTAAQLCGYQVSNVHTAALATN
jgi:hypothetical protein